MTPDYLGSVSTNFQDAAVLAQQLLIFTFGNCGGELHSQQGRTGLGENLGAHLSSPASEGAHSDPKGAHRT